MGEGITEVIPELELKIEYLVGTFFTFLFLLRFFAEKNREIQKIYLFILKIIPFFTTLFKIAKEVEKKRIYMLIYEFLISVEKELREEEKQEGQERKEDKEVISTFVNAIGNEVEESKIIKEEEGKKETKIEKILKPLSPIIHFVMKIFLGKILEEKVFEEIIKKK